MVCFNQNDHWFFKKHFIISIISKKKKKKRLTLYLKSFHTGGYCILARLKLLFVSLFSMGWVWVSGMTDNRPRKPAHWKAVRLHISWPSCGKAKVACSALSTGYLMGIRLSDASTAPRIHPEDKCMPKQYILDMHISIPKNWFKKYGRNYKINMLKVFRDILGKDII